MPKCFGCRKSVDPYDLKAIGDDLFCSGCRTFRSEPARAEKPKKEVTMSEKRKAIASVQIFPNEKEDDYDIEGYVRVGGVKLELDTNLNRLRDFFTKRRTRKDRQDKGKNRPGPSAIPVEERC
jgi:hypothetical protein